MLKHKLCTCKIGHPESANPDSNKSHQLLYARISYLIIVIHCMKQLLKKVIHLPSSMWCTDIDMTLFAKT